MTCFLTFIEGIITFISPCLLPLLPVYLGFFAGGGPQRKKNGALFGALGFILGFTAAFTAMGAVAGGIGAALARWSGLLEKLGGLLIILFGLNYLGVLSISWLNRVSRREVSGRQPGFFASFLFGLAFSIGWSPCVGAFLGSALLMASQQGSVGQGVLLLLSYCAGLGLPFLVAALLVDQFESTLRWIKSHYRIINLVSGLLLVMMGLLMMTGLLACWIALLA